MIRYKRTTLGLFLLSLGALAALVYAFELAPGRIRNPDGDGLQFLMATAYNSEQDEYLITYEGGMALALRLSPATKSIIGSEITLSPNTNVQGTSVAYNPDRNEYFVVWRNDEPQEIFGRYLDGNGQPLTGSFKIANGVEPRVQYSTVSKRYIVVWSNFASGVWYRMVAGDSTAGQFLLTGETLIESAAISGRVAYGSVSNKFLVVYTKDGGANKSEVRGEFVSGSGALLAGVTGIGFGSQDQQVPEVGYSSSTDTWLVAFEDWSTGGFPNVNAQIVNANGFRVGSRFTITPGSSAWDVPGPVTYNEITQKWVATWFVNVDGFAREVDPVTRELEPAIHFSNQNAFPLGAASRPDPADPQALVVWREGFGVNGVHASIIHLPPPPPQINAVAMPDGFFGVAYSEQVPVIGGDLPLTYELVSGNLAPGLSGPDPNTGIISGTPTEVGTFGPFTIRVTDEQGRFDEGELTHEIQLAPPTPLAPTGSTNDTTPTFEWQASPGATSYNLEVENLTSGGIVINQSGITTTSFTPGTDLEGNAEFRWRMQASDGGNVSPFSPWTHFAVDTTPPAAVTLTGSVPSMFTSHGGLTAVASSGELAGSTPMSNVADGDTSTIWSSPARDTMQTEFITVDLGAVKEMDRVRMRSRVELPELFPIDFQIQVSDDNVNFSTVLTVSDFVATAATWFDFDFVTTSGRYVRIWVTEAGKYSGNDKFYVQIAEIEVQLGSPATGAIRVDWLAPGDDENTGQAVSYDIRYQQGMNINFGSASKADAEPAPLPAGSPQSFTISGLLDETFYTVALKAMDDAGNVSNQSNAVTIVTTGTAPGAVGDLSTVNPGFTSIDVQWTAPPEDGSTGGAATSYDLRYSTGPITDSNWDSATPVSGEPAPATPGQPQTTTVSSLESNTNFYFGLKSVDEAGNISPLSNIAEGQTLDDVPPDAITDLGGMGGGITYVQVASPSAVSASGELSVHVKERAVDGDLSKIWSTPGRDVMQVEQITLDLGDSFEVGRVRMRSRSDLGDLFPRDFQIQVSNDNVNFTTVHSVSDFVAAAGTWFTFDFPAFSGRYVRIRVTESNAYSGNGKFYVQIAEIEIFEAQQTMGAVTLQWTATGDDGSSGQAQFYDLRYSPDPILTLTDFNAATEVVGEPTPQVAGSLESVQVTGLGDEAVLWWAIRAGDELPNLSPLSNTVKVATPGTPPDAVTDLQVTGRTGSSITIQWTASGDDGSSGTAASYDVRFSTSPINNLTDFASATAFPFPGSPQPAGQTESLEITGLDNETQYYIALRVIDDADLMSGLSNVVSETTLDVVPPAAIVDFSAALFSNFTLRPATAIASSGALSVHVKERAVDGDLSTIWSTPARDVMQTEFITLDLGASFGIGRVRMRSRSDLGDLFPRDFQIQVSDDNVNFTTVHSVNDFVAAAGTWFTFDFTPANGRYVRIWITETNAFSGNGKFYAQIAEIEVFEGSVSASKALLEWTAPGDNGGNGTASAYDIRFSAMPIGNDTDFDNATQVVGENAPKSASSSESFVVDGIPGETTVHFAIKTADEVPNWSELSNLPSLVTPAIPPAAIADLRVTGSTDTSITTEWTATGDDGPSGQATSYDIRYRAGPIENDADFDSAIQVSGEPAPKVAGETESFTITGLDPDTSYSIAIKVADEAANISALSNVAVQKTDDVVAPAQVTDLSGVPGGTVFTLRPSTAIDSSGALSVHVKERAVDGDLSTIWSSPARDVMQVEFITLDLGSLFDVGRVRMRSRSDLGDLFPRDFAIQVSNDNVNFTTVHSVKDFVAAAATWFTFDFAATSGRFVRILVTESNAFSGNGKFYVQIAEIETYQATELSDRITLSWTAPGDNGSVGTAETYDIRYSPSPIVNDTDFDVATQADGEPAPKAAGSDESFTLTGLDPATTYHIALKTLDEGGNTSALSNVITVATP